MTPEELYDELVVEFPILWPVNPEWSWINVHNGQEPKVEVLSDLLAQVFSSPEVIVLVHSNPGIAVRMPQASVAKYVAQFMLRHEVQVADPKLNRFISVASNGVATSDA